MRLIEDCDRITFPWDGYGIHLSRDAFGYADGSGKSAGELLCAGNGSGSTTRIDIDSGSISGEGRGSGDGHGASDGDGHGHSGYATISDFINNGTLRIIIGKQDR